LEFAGSVDLIFTCRPSSVAPFIWALDFVVWELSGFLADLSGEISFFSAFPKMAVLILPIVSITARSKEVE
jgi:hypothetical protein